MCHNFFFNDLWGYFQFFFVSAFQYLNEKRFFKNFTIILTFPLTAHFSSFHLTKKIKSFFFLGNKKVTFFKTEQKQENEQIPEGACFCPDCDADADWQRHSHQPPVAGYPCLPKRMEYFIIGSPIF